MKSLLLRSTFSGVMCWLCFQLGAMWNQTLTLQTSSWDPIHSMSDYASYSTDDSLYPTSLRTMDGSNLRKEVEKQPKRTFSHPMYKDGKPPTNSPLRRPRVLMGILSADFKNDLSYRKRHRELFRLWNDTRVCSLPTWLALPDPSSSACELIYTFVLGGGNPEGPPELVGPTYENGTSPVPILVSKPIPNAVGYDLSNDDMSILNIRENMNEGKSQTFLYFATTIMTQYDGLIDYVMKCDADSLLHLHDYLYFAHRHLPPLPYNQGIYAGALRDKAYWPKHETADLVRYESYWGNHYEGVHLYIAGQCYILSKDLAAFIVSEAPRSKSYQEGHEDHDISAMAWHSPSPVHMLTISKKQRFWEHPVKGEPRWRRIFLRESARMNNETFEGKKLRLYTAN